MDENDHETGETMSVILRQLRLECEHCPDSPRIIRDWISAGFEDAAKAMFEYRIRHSKCGDTKEQGNHKNNESILAEKTTVDGLFAIARALHCVSDSIRDQTNRVTAVNQQIAVTQASDTAIQQEWLRIHLEKARKE